MNWREWTVPEWATYMMMLWLSTFVVAMVGIGVYDYLVPKCPPPKEVIKYVERIKEVMVPSDVTLRVTTTGYCPDYPCVAPKWQDGLTATGKRVRRGFCASDWTYFPPGTTFDVPGYGPCQVEDSGNLVKGRHLDLYFPTEWEARQWGRQSTEVTLTRWGREGGGK